MLKGPNRRIRAWTISCAERSVQWLLEPQCLRHLLQLQVPPPLRHHQPLRHRLLQLLLRRQSRRSLRETIQPQLLQRAPQIIRPPPPLKLPQQSPRQQSLTRRLRGVIRQRSLPPLRRPQNSRQLRLRNKLAHLPSPLQQLQSLRHPAQLQAKLLRHLRQAKRHRPHPQKQHL
jgi:hypothetical protein